MDRFYFTMQRRLLSGVHVAERFKPSATALCGEKWHYLSSHRPLGVVKSLDSIGCDGCRKPVQDILEKENE